MKIAALSAALGVACNFNQAYTSPEQTSTTTCPPLSTPQPSGGVPAFHGEEEQAVVPPPPLSGGTLAAFSRGEETYVVASVPETDRLTIAHITGTPAVMGEGSLVVTSRELTLDPHDEPGRIIEDGAGRVHVVLRGAGSILTFDPVTLAVAGRRSVCSAPRGIAYQQSNDSLEVVCATGELVALPASGGDATQRVFVDRDLRDVVSLGDRLLVTRFRSAELLTLDLSGTILRRGTLPSREGRTPHVAWRMTETQGRVAIVYELASTAPIDVRRSLPQLQSQYGAPSTSTPMNMNMPGPVVIAAIAETTDGVVFEPSLPVPAPAFDTAIDIHGSVAFFASGPEANGTVLVSPVVPPNAVAMPVLGRQVPALAFAVHGQTSPVEMLFTQSRQPAAIAMFAKVGPGSYFPVAGVPLSGMSDTGFDIFHTPTQAGVACVSCHPEGGDDGHTWHFITQDVVPDGGCPTPGLNPAPAVPRRTQSLRGGILSTAPLHWDGDMGGMGDILTEVFTRRMNGGVVTPGQRAIFERWIDSIPRAPQRTDLDSAKVDSGRAVFEGKGGCADCHSGAKLTNNATLDVGRGPLQVPMLLGVGARAPFLHDGCAATLADRFDPECGGSHHGNSLSPTEQSDVVQYLESL